MRGPSLPQRFVGSSQGTVAIEFAFAMPVLIVMLMLGIQIVAYVSAVRKVELLATSISEMISQKAPPTPGAATAYVNAQDLHFSYDAGLVVFPYLMSDARRQNIAWWQDIYIDYSSVQFTNIPGTNCPANGDQSSCYIASVVWTSMGTTGPNYRACGLLPGLPTQLAMDDTSPPNKLYLPRSVFGPGSVIVIDIVFTFHPVFAGNLLPNLTIARSVYVRPRYASLIDFNTSGNDGIATLCPGYF